MKLAIAAVVLCQLTLGASAQTFVEGFEGGSNEGSWTWFGPGESVVATGGNPDAFLHSGFLDTFAPRARSPLGTFSIFQGDYRARNVTSIGCDLQTLVHMLNSCPRPLSLILTNDSGTPGDPNDDAQVYVVGPGEITCPDGQWHSYDFPIDAQSASIPSGWAALPPFDATPDVAWNQVITDVDAVTFFYGDPTFFFIFAEWQVGLDNPRISEFELPTTYCTGKTNSLGCVPFISVSGTPSASDPNPFLISGGDLLPNQLTILLYGFGKSNLNFHGGKLCIKAPLRRLLPAKQSDSAGGPPCSGTTKRNFNNRIQSGADPLLSVGQTVFSQYIQRDSADPAGFGDSLTDALRFVIKP